MVFAKSPAPSLWDWKSIARTASSNSGTYDEINPKPQTLPIPQKGHLFQENCDEIIARNPETRRIVRVQKTQVNLLATKS